MVYRNSVLSLWCSVRVIVIVIVIVIINLKSKVMKAAEFQIINGGQRNSLDFNNRIVIEFISGYGQGGQSYWCEFVSIYKAYRQKGSKLEECGRITEISGTDRKSFKGEIDGKEISSDFLTASEVFTRIEKIKKS